MIKLIMFDLDGTLVDSAGDITNAINYATEPHGLRELTVQQTVGLVGEGLTRLLEKVLGPERADMMPDVMSRFVEYYSAHLADLTIPYPGVVETLDRLTGYIRAVISNKRESLSRELLGRLGLLEHFHYVLGSDSAEERKPSPGPLLHVLRMARVAPAEAVMVGDSIYDIQAGRAAGVITVAVTYGYRDRESLKDADYVIDRMEELPAVLQRVDEAGR